MAIWSRFFGGAVSTGVGVAIGNPVSATLEPIVQELANLTWAETTTRGISRPLDVMTLAVGVAQSQISYDAALAIAHEAGFSKDRFDKAVAAANVGPGVTIAFELWRRNVIGEPGFRRAVSRIGLEAEWIDDLVKLKDVRLSPATVANAVQQGHMPNHGILPTIDPTITFPPGYQQPPSPDGAPPSHVPLTQIDIDPLTEAAASGVDTPRLQVEANLVGLPPGPEALLAMWNRNYIDESSVDAGIREGHMKTKWAHAFKRMRWGVLSAETYAGAWLRGWLTRDEAIKGGELTGHTPEQMHLLYQNRGRPVTPVQALTALVRRAPSPKGQDYPEHAGPFNQADFDLAIRRSDIRTEYIPTLRELLYAYPSLFQLNRLVQAGAISADTAREWAVKDRYAPEVVTTLHTYWQGLTGTTTANANVTKAQTQLWTTTHRSYIATESGDDDARARFQLLGIPSAAQAEILTLWQSERALIRAQLSPADLRKAYQQVDINPVTQAHWTRDEARAGLLDRGWSWDDAEAYLNIPYKG